MIRKSISAMIGILGVALGLVVATAVQNRRIADLSTNAAKGASPRTYAMNVAISSMPFWSEPKQTWETIGNVTPGLKTIFSGPNDSDPSKQIEQMEALMSQEINGIILFSTDPNALVPVIDKAVEKGISVVTVFADVPKSKRIAYVGANQVESAKAVARQAMQDYRDRVKPDAKVLISVGKIGAEDQDDRRKGFEEQVGGKMKLLTPVIDDYKPDKAAAVIRAALNLNPDIKFIFGCDSQSALGAISALKELGKKPGDVIVTAWDSEAVVMDQIKAGNRGVGWVQATAVLYSRYMVETAFAFLEADHFGYLYPTAQKPSTGARRPAAPRSIEIPIRIVTANNVDEFLSEQLQTNSSNASGGK